MPVKPAAEKTIAAAARGMNHLAAVTVLAMMLLTALDVILRFFRCPIPGTYEVVGYLGALTIAFALALTSLKDGHIAVDVFMQKMPPAMARWMKRFNLLISAALFGVMTVYLVLYGLDSRSAGDVSMTLQIPVYPFIFGVAAGCALLSAVLMLQLVISFEPPPAGDPADRPKARKETE